MDNDIREVKYLSVKECASILGVFPDTIKNAIKAGKLKAFKAGSVGSSRYRILESDFKEYLSINTTIKNQSIEMKKKKVEENKRLNDVYQASINNQEAPRINKNNNN